MQETDRQVCVTAASGEEQVPGLKLDPFSIVQQEIESITERIRRSVLIGIPALENAAGYFFNKRGEGKRFRPTMLMLMASSLGADAPGPHVLTVDNRRVCRPFHIHHLLSSLPPHGSAC